MAGHTVSASAAIAAPAERIYRVIADYRGGHPHILPRPPFGELTVEAGGVGEGTVVNFTLRLLGRTQQFRAVIAEPEPGRVLVERNLDGGATTTFTVEPQPGGQTSLVTIATTTTVRDGIAGAKVGAIVHDQHPYRLHTPPSRSGGLHSEGQVGLNNGPASWAKR